MKIGWKARVIGADSDPHSAQLYYVRLGVNFLQS